MPKGHFVRKTIAELTIEDERSFRHVGLYADLKEVLRRDAYVFRVLPASSRGRWDRALLLNLTFWGAAGGDVLPDDTLAADVVTHAAWHHLAGKAFAAPLSADALFLGEAIASAFDLYLVGRLLGHAPQSSFLETQVPQMSEAASAAGLSEEGFEAMLEAIAADPERAFADLRELLWDATRALLDCSTMGDALGVLERFGAHRFGALLHRYELSNWVLYARAYAANATDPLGPDARVRAIEEELRSAADPLAWLTERWVAAALAG
jgi:hypothetical protein